MKCPSNLHQCDACTLWFCADRCPHCGAAPDAVPVVNGAPAAAGAPSSSKYRNRPTELNRIKFASVKEAKRYSELCLMQDAGIISALELQVPFELEANGHYLCKYVADFVYTDSSGLEIVEDVKPTIRGGKAYKNTAAYRLFRLKAKLMLACHGIAVREV